MLNTTTSRASDLSAILNQVYVGLAEVDLRGRVVSANERFCALIERSPEAVLVGGLSLSDILDINDRPAFQQALEQFGAGYGPFVQEVRVTTPDKRSIWVELAAAPFDCAPFDSAQGGQGGGGEPKSAFIAATDISRRKRADARANETQRRFHEVADAAPVFIWTSGTDRQRRHTWVNTRWTEFRGRPMEAELGSAWANGVHPEDVPGCLSAYTSAFDERQPFTVEYRLRRNDGEYRWMLDSGTPMRDDHGEFIGYIGSSVDISERKAIEHDREALLASESAARADAERANRLKDEFLSILSHELRTPLNAVLGWVHLLRTSATSETQLDRGLTVIERNARLQTRMVDDLLDMSGMIAGKMRLETRHVPIERVVDAVSESLLPAFVDKGVTLERSSAGDPGLVDGDPNRLHQIFWNLLSNALKFTPSGGRVTVSLERDDDEVQIVVRDNGQGIATDFLPFVFERFRQGDASTRRSQGGLGIGLALVKSLTELHGGRVLAASDGPGNGSEFTVALPTIPRPERMEPIAAPAGTRLEEAYGN